MDSPIDSTSAAAEQNADCRYVPEQIVSGGQTGVDRGALDAAMTLGINHGGWCPAGRLAEDGEIPPQYALDELSTRSYPDRTERNVIDSTATLILFRSQLSGGTLLTQKVCRRESKPMLCVDLARQNQAIAEIREWLENVRPEVLNVAGPRESNAPGIQLETQMLLIALLG